MKRNIYIMLSSILLFIFIILPVTAAVNAAEITPDPSTYVLGSTSEFSTGEVQNTAGDGSLANADQTLADTGQNVRAATAIGMLIVSFSLLFLIMGSRIHNEN